MKRAAPRRIVTPAMRTVELALFGLVVLGCNCERATGNSARPSAVVAAPSGSPEAADSATTPRAAPSARATASAAAPSASTQPEVDSDPKPFPKRTTDAWPIEMGDCSYTPCKLAGGAPGISCKPGQACFNPCLPGMGPEKDRWSCAKLCKSNADCGKDSCVNGVCDRWPKHPCKDPQDNCTTADGQVGFRCSAKDKCLPMCKRGLVAYGGTHCAKPCKSDGDCPGGWCSEDVCLPLCPSEGCPYRWE